MVSHILYDYIKIEGHSFLDKTFPIFFPCGFNEVLGNSFYINHFNEGLYRKGIHLHRFIFNKSDGHSHHTP